MIKKPGLLLIIQVLFIVPLAAQDSLTDDSKHYFSIGTGYSKHVVRDDIISPLTYRGATAPLSLTYRYWGRKNRHMVDMYYDNFKLNSSAPYNSVSYAENTKIQIAYAFNRRIDNSNNINTKLYLGGRFLTMLNLGDYYFVSYINHAAPEAIASLGINLFVEKYTKGKNIGYMYFNIGVPLSAYIVLNDRYNAEVAKGFDDLGGSTDNQSQVLRKGDFV
jgi:hypothetical protein